MERVDAVVIGVGTLNADDPQLTVRHVEGHNPVRVLLDPTGRARPDCHLFHDGQARVLHLQAQGAGAANPPLPPKSSWAGIKRKTRGCRC